MGKGAEGGYWQLDARGPSGLFKYFPITGLTSSPP